MYLWISVEKQGYIHPQGMNNAKEVAMWFLGYAQCEQVVLHGTSNVGTITKGYF
jgi:hypothetical protein